MLFESIKERDERFEATILDLQRRLAAAVVTAHQERDQLIKIAQGASPVSRAAIARDPDISEFVFDQLDAREAGESPPDTAEIKKLRQTLAKAREDQRNLRLSEVRNLTLDEFEELSSEDRAKVYATDAEIYATFLDEITERNTEALIDEKAKGERLKSITFEKPLPGQRGQTIPGGGR